MATNLFAALLQTIGNTTNAAAEAYATTRPTKGKKKGPGCTPCAVNARVNEAKARAGFVPGGAQ